MTTRLLAAQDPMGVPQVQQPLQAKRGNGPPPKTA
jgi:hypothetical protein